MMNKNKTDDAYFDWLCRIVGVDRFNVKKRYLLHDLQDKTFVWDLPNDDNRSEDGIQLRVDFESEYPGSDFDYSLDGNSSVLEMMIALAIRIDGILAGLDSKRNIDVWFNEMLENLQLETYESWMDEAEIIRIRQENDRKLNIFMNRDYQRNGGGGLFPLRSAKMDQRKVELWYQMMAYLNQNYV